MTENGPERLTRRKMETKTLQELLRRLQVEFIKTGFRETQIKSMISQNNNDVIPQKREDEKVN